jgi:hypothetical protein
MQGEVFLDVDPPALVTTGTQPYQANALLKGSVATPATSCELWSLLPTLSRRSAWKLTPYSYPAKPALP